MLPCDGRINDSLTADINYCNHSPGVAIQVGPSEQTCSCQKDKKLSRKEIAELVGKNIAKKIISKGIDKVAFDRGKYKYHGLIKILAEAARVEGLNF